MKRSRSQSSAERSLSDDGESSDNSNTETNSSCDSYELEESSPPSPAPVRAKPEVKVSNRTSSFSLKQKSNTSNANSSSKSPSSSISKGQEKYAKRSSSCKASGTPQKVKDEYTSHSIRKKVHASASHTKRKPPKERKSDHTSKTKVIEIIDSSTSEYSPSDEDDETGSSSSSESESETQSRPPEKPAYKKVKTEFKHDPKSVPANMKAKVDSSSTQKKHTSRQSKAEGKEPTRFSREEDAAIISFIDQNTRTVDLMKHLHETFPDRQPRNKSSVRYRRKSILKKCQETILGTESQKE